MNDIPKWLLEQEGVTQREWKTRKRRELKTVIDVFRIYHIGCAYTPAKSGEVGRILEDFKSLKEALSVKNWGR